MLFLILWIAAHIPERGDDSKFKKKFDVTIDITYTQ